MTELSRWQRLIFLSLLISGLFLSGTVLAAEIDQSTTDGEIVSTTHPDIVSEEGSFELIVETEHTSATTVEIVGDGFDVDLSSADELETIDNKIRFIDPDKSSSNYTVTVNISNGESNTNGEIVTWVNSEEKADADDQTTSTFTIVSDSDGSLVDQKTVLRSGSTVAINSSGLAAVSVTNLPEGTTVSDISAGGVETSDGVLWSDLSGLPDTVYVKLTPPTGTSELDFVVGDQLIVLSVVDPSVPDDLPNRVTDEQYLVVANSDGEITQTALSAGINEWFISDENRVGGVKFSQTELSQLINYWFINQ